MIKVYLNRKVSETQITIGNQYESGVNAIDFDLSELKEKWPNGNIYLLVSRKEHTWPYSIDDGKFKIEYILTWKRGFYQMNVVVTDEKITDKLESSNTIFVSYTINAYVNENQINAKALTEQELPRELQIVYDDLITLKKNIEKDLADGKYIGPQGPKGDTGDKGDPGDVTEEYRNLASQIAQNASDAQTSATNAQTSATNAQKALDDAKDFVNQTKSELNQIKTDTSALKDEANTSAVNAKTSENKAKEYADKLQESTDDISQLKEDLGDLNTSVFEVKESPNIFDKTKINQDKALVTWGTPTMTNYTYDKIGWATSYPIAVHGGSTIHVYKFENGVIQSQDIANLITFAKDGSFIALEGQKKNEIKLSENTAYIIFDINNLTFIDSLMLTTEPYNGVYQEYGRKIVDKIAKIAEDVSKINSDKTHIIFSFDAFNIDNRFELMKSYGFPFTIAIASTILTYPISKENYYNYFIDGDVDFSIYGGKGDRPADYRSDKDKWSTWLKGLVDGLKETSGLYYPVMYSCQNNASSDILNQVVKENGFRMCRNGTYYNADGTTSYGILTGRKYLIDGTKYFDYYPLSIVKQEGYPTVEEIKTEIDNAIEKKKSIMLFTHYVKNDTEEMSDFDCPLSKFTAVLDYVKEKVDAGLCDVKNARQFWNYYNQQDGLDRDYKRTNMRNLFDATH